MSIQYFQKGFNYAQDGPGNRLVYHLQGCNLCCPWCANPEGMSFSPPLMQRSAVLPAYLCPNGAISPEGTLDREHCQACPQKHCLTTYRNTYLVCCTQQASLDAIYQEVLSARSMMIEGGGVTFTGGEATMQLKPLKELLQRLHTQQIHTAVETNCTNPNLPGLLPYLDYFIGDYKHYDPEKLRAVTGADLRVIQKNLTTIAQAQMPMLVRILLVHHFNDSPEDAQGFLAALKPLSQSNPHLSVEFLTYHEYGKVKWEQCGMPYTMTDGFVTAERAALFHHIFTTAGIPVVKT